jgi:hypothetical protein
MERSIRPGHRSPPPQGTRLKVGRLPARRRGRAPHAVAHRGRRRRRSGPSGLRGLSRCRARWARLRVQQRRVRVVDGRWGPGVRRAASGLRRREHPSSRPEDRPRGRWVPDLRPTSNCAGPASSCSTAKIAATSPETAKEGRSIEVRSTTPIRKAARSRDRVSDRPARRYRPVPDGSILYAVESVTARLCACDVIGVGQSATDACSQMLTGRQYADCVAVDKRQNGYRDDHRR